LLVAGSCWILSGSSFGNFERALDWRVPTKDSFSQDMVAFKVMMGSSTVYWHIKPFQASLYHFQVIQRLLRIGFVVCHWKRALDKRRPMRWRFIHTVLEILTMAASSKLDKLGLQVMNAARFQDSSLSSDTEHHSRFNIYHAIQEFEPFIGTWHVYQRFSVSLPSDLEFHCLRCVSFDGSLESKLISGWDFLLWFLSSICCCRRLILPTKHSLSSHGYRSREAKWRMALYQDFLLFSLVLSCGVRHLTTPFGFFPDLTRDSVSPWRIPCLVKIP
jgi:hypothetical protein